MPVRLVQITDTHLFAGPRATLRDVCTRASLERVMSAVVARDPAPDYLAITGDIAQDETVAAYAGLRETLRDWPVPVLCLPGNHDNPRVMQTLLNDDRYRFCGTHSLSPRWAATLLDSTIPGEIGGELDDARLDALDHALATNSDRHVVVMMHHHPVPLGSAWIDSSPLGNARRFFELLERRANVRCVLFGHVHQISDTVIGGIRVMSTPSTCGQFLPFSDEFAVDTRPPAFRWLSLNDDGSFETDVVWVGDDEEPTSC